MMLSSPEIWINPIGTQPSGDVTISGTSVDDVAVDRNGVSLYNFDTEQFWNGSEWSDDWAQIEPVGNEDWSFDVDMSAGNYRVIARTWDASGNRGIKGRVFSVVDDEAKPDVWIDPIGKPIAGEVTISGTSVDEFAVDRNRVTLYNFDTGQFWNGSEWTDQWAQIEPTGDGQWSFDVDLPVGNYRLLARSWDSSGNRGTRGRIFSVVEDNTSPEVGVNPIGTPTAGVVTISGTAVDDVAVDRNGLTLFNFDTELFWNGSEWTDQWAQIEPVGNEDWSFDIDLSAGNYRAAARAWDTSGNIGYKTVTFQVELDPDDYSNQVVDRFNEVLPDDWSYQSRIQGNNIWFRTFAPDGAPQFDVRFGSAGVIAEIRDIDTGRNLLAPSYNNEVTDRVVQWTMWETGQTVRHDVPSLPDFEDRFNLTQAGTYENVLNGTVDVDLNPDEGQIDVWSVADNNWKFQQDPHMDGTITSLTRTEVLDGGAILVRRVVRVGEIKLNGQAVSMAKPYFEAWSPFSDSVFDSMAFDISPNGTPNVWYADGFNIPHYSNTPVDNTRGWAMSYNRSELANGPTMSVVFGSEKAIFHDVDGSSTTRNGYRLNTMDFNGGMAILPGLYTDSLHEGAIIDQHMIFMPGNGIDDSTRAQLDALAALIPPPQVYQAGAPLDGELFAIADRLSTLHEEPSNGTEHLGVLV